MPLQTTIRWRDAKKEPPPKHETWEEDEFLTLTHSGTIQESAFHYESQRWYVIDIALWDAVNVSHWCLPSDIQTVEVE